jgi:hypothetical protein
MMITTAIAKGTIYDVADHDGVVVGSDRKGQCLIKPCRRDRACPCPYDMV